METTVLFGNRVFSLIDTSVFWVAILILLRDYGAGTLFYFIAGFYFVYELLKPLGKMLKTKKRSVCLPKKLAH